MDCRVITSVLLLFVWMRSVVNATYINEFVANIEGGRRVADRLAGKYGFINVGEMENFPNHYMFHHRAVQKRSARPSTGDHSRIKHEASVHWIEQQVIRKRTKRDTSWMSDPRYHLQWYLNRRDAPNMNVEAAWDMGITGKGVVVSILDDGIDYTHPDLAKNYDPLASYDINSNDDDPMPWANYDQTNRHGTRCAGEVAMEAGNGICGVGVAYNASIGGIRMLDDEVTDSVEGRSLATHRDHIDIYSSSWGPEDNGMTVDGPGRMAKKAFEDGIKLIFDRCSGPSDFVLVSDHRTSVNFNPCIVSKGRGGKGSIFVWASGNGGRAKDSCGCDGYTNSIYTISVSSTSERGQAPWYLEECASTLATTYSSGSPKERKVITTDLSGRCTDDHTGTSASAPLAAGLCALALQANPNLTWRDLQYIIVMTSRRTNLEDSDWFVNGAGYSVSYLYGFGLMDAGAMVQLAQNWINLPEQRKCVMHVEASSREISGHGVMASFTLNMTSCGSLIYLEHVQSSISASFSNRGALVFTLVSPSGTQSRLLARRPRDKRKGSFSSWPFMSTHFWGETARGVWTLLVENRLPKSNWGRFHKWELTLYGTDSLPSTIKPQSSSKPAPAGSGASTSTPVKPVKPNAKLEVEHSLVAIPRSSEYFGPCHRECFNGCKGPLTSDCFKCLHYRDRNTNECVEHCPDIGYYDPPQRHTKCKACFPTCQRCSGATTMDCLSCPEGSFLMESRSECVAQCNEDGFYADSDTNTCKQCDPLCSRCIGNSSHCLDCKPHTVLTSRNSCVLTCSVNEYMQGTECLTCSGTCYTCNGDGLDNCLSCIRGYVLKERACVQKGRCTDGYYISDAKECIRCHVTCKDCDGPSSKDCTECASGLTFQDERCVSNCQEGYYKGTNGLTDGFCMSCDVGCDQCTNATNCVKCAPELVLVQGSCKQGCREGTYEYEGHCRDCHDMCKACVGAGPDDCTKCAEGVSEHRYLFESACVPFCPDGRYGDIETLQCLECDETCQTCNGSEIKNCLSCFGGFALGNNTCQERERCNSACKRCLEGSSDRCRSCNDNKFLLNVECVDICPSQYFKNTEKHECQLCHPSCKTCSGTSSQDCKSCYDGQFLFDGSTCDSHCPYTTYPDSTTKNCLECHPSCQSCSGPGNNACETCEGGRFWYKNKCWGTCPQGTYGDIEEQQCLKCFPTCLSCDGPFSIDCRTCIEGLTLDFGSCESGCTSPRTYRQASDGTCNDCHESCMTCRGPQPTDCMTCDYDHFLNHEGQCIMECVSGYYPDYDSNTCRTCHSSCLSCVKGGPEDCMDCKDGTYILYTEQGIFCVDQCPETYYRPQHEDGLSSDMSQTCQECSPQCKDCADSYSKCLSCPDNAFLYRDQCRPKCPRGFTGDVESNRCIAENKLCPLNCRNCDQWGECSDCDAAYHLYYGDCIQRPCNASHYQALDASGNRVCRLCAANCKRCLGPRLDECLGCIDSFHLSNGECVQECTPNQFARGNVCYACHPSCTTCTGPSPYDCMLCPEGTLSIHTGECNVGCPQGTFLEPDDNHCVRCYNSCRTCEGPSDSQCLSCIHNYYLTGNQKCEPTCPDGSYRFRDQDATTDFECRPCHSNCQTCYGPWDSECVTCHANMYLLQHECVAHCGTGYYPGPGTHCKPCHTDCKSCWGGDHSKCITCANDKKLVDSHCEDECPEDRYLSFDYGHVCEKCHTRCKTCDDMGPFNCLSCLEGYELEEKVCYSRCDPGFYYINDNQTCEACQPNCKECFGPTDKQCIDCHDGQHLFSKDTEHFTCVSCCKDGQDPDNDNCCNCANGGCTLQHLTDTRPPKLHGGVIVFFCILAVCVFVLFFGLLQARSHKMFCWKNSYDQLPTFYNNKGEEPEITLRQNVLPSSDEDDYFVDDDSDLE